MATKIQKRTAELMLKKLQSKLDGLYNDQEASKAPTMTQEMKCGGKLKKKMPWGGDFLSNLYQGIQNTATALPGVTISSGPQNPFKNVVPYNVNHDLMMNDMTEGFIGGVAPGLTMGAPFDSSQYSGIDVLGSEFGPNDPMISGSGAGTYNNTGITGSSSGNSGFGLGNVNFNPNANTALSALALAPMAYNLIQGARKEDRLNPMDYYNPYEAQIRSTMANRRFNVDPILEANRNAAAIADYNALNSGLSAGGANASRLGNLASRLRADSGAYAQKQNMDNTYLYQQAMMDANLGQQRASTKLGIRDINDRNAAARRNYLSQGFGDVSNWAQTQQLMNNQRAMEPLYGDILKNYNPYSMNYYPTFYNRLNNRQNATN